DLAVVILWQAIDEPVAARALETGNAVEAKLIEHGRRDVGAWPPHYKGNDFLTPIGVRMADRRRFQYTSMPDHHLLALARIDVGAAGNYHVLGTVLDCQKAVGVERPEIAGPQPAIAQGHSIGGSIVPVALHHAIAPGDDLTHLPRWQVGAVI